MIRRMFEPGIFALQAADLERRGIVLIAGSEENLEDGVALIQLRDECLVSIWINAAEGLEDRDAGRKGKLRAGLKDVPQSGEDGKKLISRGGNENEPDEPHYLESAPRR